MPFFIVKFILSNAKLFLLNVTFSNVISEFNFSFVAGLRHAYPAYKLILFLHVLHGLYCCEIIEDSVDRFDERRYITKCGNSDSHCDLMLIKRTATTANVNIFTNLVVNSLTPNTMLFFFHTDTAFLPFHLKRVHAYPVFFLPSSD